MAKTILFQVIIEKYVEPAELCIASQAKARSAIKRYLALWAGQSPVFESITQTKAICILGFDRASIYVIRWRLGSLG
jgi:hypothetical protein